ncbi:MAG: hypothetical protein JNN28_15070 [Saprospiraceae bacterium]|nr:hypothetical protein [Saprospiraceae bacterium]
MKIFKQFFPLIAFVFLAISSFAQKAPSGINYQAVLRNQKGDIISDQPVRMRVSILDPESRIYYYTETHLVTTNLAGIFSVIVGGGQAEEGKFTDIPWSTANTWLEIAYDTDNNGTYEMTGTTRMLTVPYAFYAERAGVADQASAAGHKPNGAEGDDQPLEGEHYWQLKGNSEIDEDLNFLGSRNYADLVVKTHDIERMRITKGMASDAHDAQIQFREHVYADQNVWIVGELFVGKNADITGSLNIDESLHIGDNLDVDNSANIDVDLHVGRDADIDRNLNVDNDTHIGNDLDVDGNGNIDMHLHVGKDVDVDNNLNVDNDTHIGNDLDVDGNGNIDMHLHVGKDVDVDNNLNVDNDTHIGNDLDVDGNGNIDVNLHVGQNADVDNNLNVDNNTHIGNDLDVDGSGNIDVNLHVGQNADVDNNLNVDNDTHIGNDLDVDGNVNIDMNLHVVKDLDVDQDVNIDNNLTVQNNAYILGDLEVTGEGSFYDMAIQNNLNVGNDVDIDHNLNVDNSVTIGVDLMVTDDVTVGDDLTVTGTSLFESAVTMENNLTVQQNLTVNSNITVGNDVTVNNDVTIGGDLNVDNPITANCRLVVNSCVTGSDLVIDNYPVVVQGGDQGIAIKVDGTRSNDNNYVAFWDENGIQGRIEGQTYSELTTSFPFIWSNAMYAAEEALSIAMVIACGLQLDAAEAIVWGVEGLFTAAEWIEFDVSITENVGVAYESGSGDYAEWLERSNPQEDYNYGEIVGVRGGKISRNTRGADHVMVVSKAPIVLGNMPEPNKEKDYEKVAFMGQVPVRVMGQVAVGDYILPSGFHDGLARAVAPKSMKLEDYSQIVGVAWEAGQATTLNMVNVAVGLNQNDMSAQLQKQQAEINTMKQQLNQVFTMLGQKAPYEEQTGAVVVAPATALSAVEHGAMQNQELAGLVESKPEVFTSAFAQAKVKLLEKGIDVNKYPEIAQIYDQPIEWIKKQNEKGYLNETVARAKAQVEAQAKK